MCENLRRGRPEGERAVRCEREAAIAAVGAVDRQAVEQLVHRVERSREHTAELLARVRRPELAGATRVRDASVEALHAACIINTTHYKNVMYIKHVIKLYCT